MHIDDIDGELLKTKPASSDASLSKESSTAGRRSASPSFSLASPGHKSMPPISGDGPGAGLAPVLGAVHITGGGLIENIPRVLEKGYNARMFASKWPLPALMRWMKAAGNVKDFEFAKTFNCGLGMVS